MSDFQNSRILADDCRELTMSERKALQETGMKYFLDNRLISDFKPECAKNLGRFAYIHGILDKEPTSFFVKSVLYPENLNYFDEDDLNFFKTYNKPEFPDIYAVKLGFINKNAPESDKGALRKGVKYSVAIGDVKLISIIFIETRMMLPPYHEVRGRGYSENRPLRIRGVGGGYLKDDEDFYLKHLRAIKGIICNMTFCECLKGPKGNHLHKWEITVGRWERTITYFKYTLYLDLDNYAYLPGKEEKTADTPTFFDWGY